MKVKKKVSFFKSKKLGERNWGEEILLNLISKKLTLKILKMKKGKMGGLQYHRKKNECGHVLSGILLIKYDNGKGKLVERICKRGDNFHFPPFAVHQEKALTDCTIIEASTPYFNDRVRVEKKYNLPFKGGLKTTTRKQIKFK
jgi:mannose-6-phosphate isomerase